MRQRARFILITMLTATLSWHASADPAPDSRPIGAGTESGGWVTLAYPDSRPKDPDSDEPRPPFQQLYYLPADAPAGALYGPIRLSEKPHAIAATGESVVLLFPPSTSDGGDGSSRWKVRSLTAFDQPDTLPPIFEPRGRLEILPSLETEGDVVGFCGIPGGGVAALISPVADASGKPIGSMYQLRAMVGGIWKAVSLPEHFIASGPCRLLSDSEGLSLLFNNPNDSDSSQYTLWRGVLPKSITPADEAITPIWERQQAISPVFGNELFIAATGDYLISASPSSATNEGVPGGVVANTVRLTLHLPGSATTLATLHDIPEQFALVRVGDTAALIYFSDDPLPKVMTAVVHTSTGEILHQGVHVTVPPLSTDDLRFLGFVLALVLMTVLVFVLRPAAASKTEIKLPAGTAMANPERRLAAGLIDFAIPLFVIVEIWDTSLMDVLLAPIRAERADEFWPFAVTSLAFFGHTFISEWLFRGRTLGKVILGIHVASITGEKLTLWQCVSRNTIKLVCPPLLILIFADPRRRHPGDTLAGTVVIARAKGPEPPIDADSDQDDEGDDGPGRTNEATISDG